MDSSQPTPGVKRKIPGPESKTLKRVNYNLEAQTCNTKTKCLFCFRSVLTPFTIKAETGEDRKRIQHLKNLCNHVMKKNQDELPTDYSLEAFPFCAPCQVYVDQLWEYDEIVRKTQIKIAETILAIEKAVVDGEVLNSSLRMSTPSATVTPANDKRFMKLRDVIFTGYRNTLLKKQTLSEKLLEANKTPRTLAQQPGTASNNMENDHVKRPDVTPVRPDLVEIRGSAARQNQELSSASCETLFTLDDETGDGERNEKIPSETQDKGDSQVAPADDNSLDVTHRFDSQNIDEESRKREGMIMDGLVEIYWTSGSLHDEAYLNCSMCFHELKFPSRKAEGLSHASRMMNAHIKKIHQDKENLSQSTTKKRPTIYSCCACHVVFADTLTRDKHEVVHRNCEGCGKIFGSNGYYNKTCKHVGNIS
ncbi:unnamed protein product [Orchesella dallaii]|uniref:C2H2-type domain-containing protein n=1 Tax=Orchesella dallaii TaxID=48710 RepID=A0ABP1QJI8_9HEXA